ncbi:DUF4278 domain-containing protein [Pseudanabaena sp. FACHB-2040]|uniref:DUF4278 domain-containing protein n=1 Tax=Pseudanabaena sp. FACHB-2040 TaxID=2692859 RepID=UPI001689FA9A|nr:DUF4278 domain-containing protein [Pseudanabaena sp. FACHB-2040]MBD2256439.1 DUF4278 domain-containing protein [Pseudanabaena sp. FACHB-2040]
MQLSYRGVKYEYTPPVVAAKSTDETGTFRGVDIRFRTIAKAPVQQSTLDLMYRGVGYRTGETAAPVAQPVTAPAAIAAPAAPVATRTTEDRARMMLINHHRLVKRRQQSMLSRSATEAGMPADASRYWNHIQGKVHPSFWATYDRGHASAS